MLKLIDFCQFLNVKKSLQFQERCFSVMLKVDNIINYGKSVTPKSYFNMILENFKSRSFMPNSKFYICIHTNWSCQILAEKLYGLEVECSLCMQACSGLNPTWGGIFVIFSFNLEFCMKELDLIFSSLTWNSF